MTAGKKTIALWIALAALLTLLIPSGFAMAESAKLSEIVAEKVPFSQLAPGDRFVIVCENGNASLSTNAHNNDITAANVTLAHTDSRDVLTSIDPEVAVFELEPADDEGICLKCQSGYLATEATESGLKVFYSPDPDVKGIWHVIDHHLVLSPSAVTDYHQEPSANICLDYLPKGFIFNLYPRKKEADTPLHHLHFYRLGNSVPGETVKEDAQYRLPVFGTSDVHGYLADTAGDEAKYLLAYISDKVKDVRGRGSETRKDYAVLLDGGDIYQGNALSSRFRGGSLSAAFDIMGYDAVTVGNHEFDWHLDQAVDPDGTMPDYSFLDISGVNTVPVIVCNLYQNGEKVPCGGDYVILEKTARDRLGNELPVKIGVIGMAGNYEKSIIRSLFSDLGYEIKPDYEYVNALARQLETDGQCDATILLIHEEPSYVVKNYLGEDTAIDLVYGGHAHRTVNGETASGLTYMEPSCYGKAYMCADMVFECTAGKPEFQDVRNAHLYLFEDRDTQKLLNTAENAEELDAQIVQLTDEVNDVVSDYLSSEVGFITESVYRYSFLPGSAERASTCGNWVASIFARAADADVAFMNRGGLRKDLPIEPGAQSRTITLSDLFEMFPSENAVCCYELTWEELLNALEYAMTPGGKIILTHIIGVDCYFTDDGIQAIVTPDGEAVYANGVWKEGWKDKKLRVALNEYLATTNRKRGDEMSNPFVAWYDSPRLVLKGEADIDAAIRVLVQEATRNGGLLAIDTAPHFINSVYPPE